MKKDSKNVQITLVRVEKKEKDRKMGSMVAVFNQHINDAGKRALKVMEENYPLAYARVVEIEKQEHGIMGIFHQLPEEATMMYVALVTAFVNEY